jgi:predicted permease
MRDWGTLSSSFSGMAATTIRPGNLVGMGEPREVQMARATPELFGVLGVQPVLGRTFSAAAVDELSIVLSDALWRSQFGADPAVIGRVVRLNGEPHTVLGVMPASFRYPHAAIEAWAPLALKPENFEDRDDTYLEVVARLRPGVSIARARADMGRVSAQLERQYPQTNKDLRASVVAIREEVGRGSKLLVLALCGAALCILVLACANLASLFLARGLYRGQELAVRAALGAGRDRLVRQLVTESLGLAIVGGVVGVGAAAAGLPLLSRLVPDGLPLAGRATLDLRVLGFATLLVLVTGLAFGLGPALAASSASPRDALGSGGRSTRARTHRIRAALIVVEVAASVVLLVASGLLIRTLLRLQSLDPGFASAQVLAVRTPLPVNLYGVTRRRVQFYDRVLEQVRALPGVMSAAYVTGLPMSMRGGIWSATVAGEPPADFGENAVGMRFATSQYFSTLGIPLRSGRDLAGTDTRQAPFVAVVSESFVHRHWPNQDPLGRTFRLADTNWTVVGVVGDVRVRGLEQTSEPQVYLPPAQVADSSVIGYTPKELVVRTADGLDPLSLVPAIRRIVHAVDPEQPLAKVRRMDFIVENETAPRATQLRLLGALALLALLIAGLGIHGLLTFTVSMRERELGIRRALGAEAGGIVRLVMREGVILAAAGIAAGVVFGYVAARGMGALLVGVRPEDPLTLGAAALLCFATAAIGSLLPALRATRVDPMTALRSE